MLAWTITPRDVYKNKPSIPTGKKVVGFRPPKPGDTVILVSGQVFYINDTSIKTPRLILADCEPEVDWWE